jgi:ribonuclease D
MLVQGDHQTIVHAGREEYLFCRRAVGTVPKSWFDVQLAAGLAGLEYPASYGKLVNRLLRQKVHKGETRSDWRRRPLSKGQIEYALQDVVHLHTLAMALRDRLEACGRSAWMWEETGLWMSRLDHAESQQKWRRLSGLSGLSQQGQRIARALWLWRENLAQLKNTLPRRILRDDLLVELARRGRWNPQDILAIRGMEYRGTRGHVEQIAVCIERAAADNTALPQSVPWTLPPQSDVLEKFLNTALTMICRKASIATSLVGTTQDIRELLSFELGLAPANEPPSLACGWRAELVGSQIVELLRGNAALRIVDPMADAPIAVSRAGGHATSPASPPGG